MRLHYPQINTQHKNQNQRHRSERKSEQKSVLARNDLLSGQIKWNGLNRQTRTQWNKIKRKNEMKC